MTILGDNTRSNVRNAPASAFSLPASRQPIFRWTRLGCALYPLRRTRPKPLPSIKHAIALLLLCAATWAQTQPAATEPASIAAAHIMPVPNAAYAGAERCRACHGAEFQEFGKTQHASIKPPHTDSITSCEMCHGPG